MITINITRHHIERMKSFYRTSLTDSKMQGHSDSEYVEDDLFTEMTQSATGFLSADSAVSFSLVRSIAVTCSILNTFSSSMYMT